MPKYSESEAFTPAFFTRVSLGEVDNFYMVNKFGAVDNLGTSLIPIATSGGYPTPTTPVSLEVVAGAADVHTTGVGAWTLQVQGLDAAWALQIKTVQLNGGTPVAIDGTWTRLFRMKVTESGSYASATTPSHVGAIEARVAGAGATWGVVDADSGFGMGQSQIGAFTVPVGQTAWLLGHHITVETGKSISVYLFSRGGCDTVAAPFTPMQVKELNRGLEGAAGVDDHIHRGPFVGPCDIGYLAKSSSGTSDVTVDFNLLVRID